LHPNSDSNQPGVIPWIDNAERPFVAGSQLIPAKWVHLAATYDGQNQRLYVDGTLVATKAQTGLILASNGALRIGGNSIWGQFFQGKIDEIRIYNKALTIDKIQKDMSTSILVSNPPKVVLGQNQLENFVDNSAKGVAVAYRATPAKSAAMTSLNVYLDSTSTATSELIAGIYSSDSNGRPSALLGKGKITAAKAGATNNVVMSPAVMLTAGKQYWFAILGPKGEIRFRDRKGTIAAPMEKSSLNTALTDLPNTWPLGSIYPTDGPMSIFGNGY
jgi:hypothetical protein